MTTKFDSCKHQGKQRSRKENKKNVIYVVQLCRNGKTYRN